MAVAGPAIRRGQMYLVRLDPTLGSEIKKTRPCVIVPPLEIRTVQSDIRREGVWERQQNQRKQGE